jgi:hypothetical protein
MKPIITILAGWFVLAAAAFAQQGPPTPAPELKKLEYFVGSWSLTGDMKPGAMGPGGAMSEDERCEWMDGNFFLVCHADFRSSMGNGSGLSIMGYNTDDKGFNYREFNSWGEFMESKGSLEGETWTWTSDEKMGGQTMKSRFTMKITSPTTYNFSFEMSQDGTKWTDVMDGKATKAK